MRGKGEGETMTKCEAYRQAMKDIRVCRTVTPDRTWRVVWSERDGLNYDGTVALIERASRAAARKLRRVLVKYRAEALLERAKR